LHFDGYYAFSDLIGVENLQQRAFSHWDVGGCVIGCWALPLILFLAALIPLPSEVRAPAVIRAESLRYVYAPEAAQIIEVKKLAGETIAGQNGTLAGETRGIDNYSVDGGQPRSRLRDQLERLVAIMIRESEF